MCLVTFSIYIIALVDEVTVMQLHRLVSSPEGFPALKNHHLSTSVCVSLSGYHPVSQLIVMVEFSKPCVAFAGR